MPTRSKPEDIRTFSMPIQSTIEEVPAYEVSNNSNPEDATRMIKPAKVPRIIVKGDHTLKAQLHDKFLY